MKSINSYIIEKLTLNKQSKIMDTIPPLEKIIKAACLHNKEFINTIKEWIEQEKVKDIEIYVNKDTMHLLKQNSDMFDLSQIKLDEQVVYDVTQSPNPKRVYDNHGDIEYIFICCDGDAIFFTRKLDWGVILDFSVKKIN